ncbi:hypothetical protein AB996_1215 [Lactococcus cremoris]|uniref:DUF262 domain-containing protein n=1 Tax=Lactococcus lactis subsp. cremoris TaxID=1359 RepID=A0A161W277_LACLC|nr:DUF262 domain-containing protein [Lactococcus cremoris]KZK06439.1 hypothetical protein AB996_1215 [Lactococcus cremoris]
MDEKLTLKKTAEWQLSNDKQEVELPIIQRDFVWNPSQIENLWDSILRGFPVGSFLFSKTNSSNYNLMDGQQRSTAIALGYFNHLELKDNNFWRLNIDTEHLPTVWLDIAPKELPKNNKYLIRVTTQSHPWGYQANKNDTKLSESDRRKAQGYLRKDERNAGIDSYFDFTNKTSFPYDSNLPVPLSLLLNYKSYDKLETLFIFLEKHLPDNIQTKQGSFTNISEYMGLLRGKHRVDLEKIIQKLEYIQGKYRINYDVLSNDALEDNSSENMNQNPILFVRMNTAGTNLSIDDLIFSIYKSKFPDSQNLVEEAGLNFLSAPQVMSLVSRMVLSELKKFSFPERMNVDRFQRYIDENSEFSSKLNKFISQKIIHYLIGTGIEIFKDKSVNLPPILIKDFIKKSSELFLFLLLWINENGKPDNPKKVVGKLLVFSYFKLKITKELWLTGEVQNPNFWNEHINVHYTKDPELCWLVSPSELKKLYLESKTIIQRFQDSKPNRWEPLEEKSNNEIYRIYKKYSSSPNDFSISQANQQFKQFFERVRNDRRLLFFAQRDYLNEEFHEYNSMEGLEDTNVPWDIDHIYPYSWTYNREKRKVKEVIRDWRNTNGNLRAISLTENRTESNHKSPSSRLEDIKKRYDAAMPEKEWNYWREISGKIYIDSSKQENVFIYKAMVSRTISIYEKFWKDLNIDELLD